MSATQQMVVVQEEKKEEEMKEQRIVASYAGCVSPLRNKRKTAVICYRVQFGHNKVRRDFTITQFGSEEKAKEAAEQYRRQQSDVLGLTIFHHLCFTKVFEPLRQQLVAGCYDGDGCVRTDRKSIQVSFSQSGPAMDAIPLIIQHFQTMYGGKAYLKEAPKLHRRPAWTLRVRNKGAQILLQHISDHGVVKKPQADLVLPIVRKKVPLHMTPKDEAVTPELIAALKVMKKQYASVPIDLRRLTMPYQAGLFESEGCVTLSESGLVAVISQASCVRLLHSICEVLQAGTVDTECIRLYGSSALAFLKSIAPFLVGKKAQVYLVLANEHLLTPGFLTDEQTKKREELRMTLSDMKHEGAWKDNDELEFALSVYNDL